MPEGDEADGVIDMVAVVGVTTLLPDEDGVVGFPGDVGIRLGVELEYRLPD